ncbi:MAG TPA: hypothetical protein VM487_20495, partial [Phycisphaerae bacterium]|nr:hypothetical protein [Phycisphaerae bacterium]
SRTVQSGDTTKQYRGLFVALGLHEEPAQGTACGFDLETGVAAAVKTGCSITEDWAQGRHLYAIQYTGLVGTETSSVLTLTKGPQVMLDDFRETYTDLIAVSAIANFPALGSLYTGESVTDPTALRLVRLDREDDYLPGRYFAKATYMGFVVWHSAMTTLNGAHSTTTVEFNSNVLDAGMVGDQVIVAGAAYTITVVTDENTCTVGSALTAATGTQAYVRAVTTGDLVEVAGSRAVQNNATTRVYTGRFISLSLHEEPAQGSACGFCIETAISAAVKTACQITQEGAGDRHLYTIQYTGLVGTEASSVLTLTKGPEVTLDVVRKTWTNLVAVSSVANFPAIGAIYPGDTATAPSSRWVVRVQRSDDYLPGRHFASVTYMGLTGTDVDLGGGKTALFVTDQKRVVRAAENNWTVRSSYAVLAADFATFNTAYFASGHADYSGDFRPYCRKIERDHLGWGIRGLYKVDVYYWTVLKAGTCRVMAAGSVAGERVLKDLDAKVIEQDNPDGDNVLEIVRLTDGAASVFTGRGDLIVESCYSSGHTTAISNAYSLLEGASGRSQVNSDTILGAVAGTLLYVGFTMEYQGPWGTALLIIKHHLLRNKAGWNSSTKSNRFLRENAGGPWNKTLVAASGVTHRMYDATAFGTILQIASVTWAA